MLVIRKATRADVPTIVLLVKELALYEKEPDAAVGSEDDFLRDGFGDRPAFAVLIAEHGDDVVGFALYFFSYSTWVGRRCLYLEDLFVRPPHRGKGAGVALMKALAQICLESQCKRFVWTVLDWNEPAIAFYKRLGATIMHEWLAVRLEGEALTRLAC